MSNQSNGPKPQNSLALRRNAQELLAMISCQGSSLFPNMGDRYNKQHIQNHVKSDFHPFCFINTSFQYNNRATYRGLQQNQLTVAAQVLQQGMYIFSISAMMKWTQVF